MIFEIGQPYSLDESYEIFSTPDYERVVNGLSLSNAKIICDALNHPVIDGSCAFGEDLFNEMNLHGESWVDITDIIFQTKVIETETNKISVLFSTKNRMYFKKKNDFLVYCESVEINQKKIFNLF